MDSTILVDDGVLHDLMSPMTAVSGSLQFLKELLAEENDPLINRRMNACVLGIDELAGMLENLRWLIGYQADPRPIELRPIPVAAVLHEVVASVRHAPHRSEQFSLVLSDDTLTVGSDPSLLKRAIAAVLETIFRIAAGGRTGLGAEGAAGGKVKIRFDHEARRLPEPLAEGLLTSGINDIQKRHGVKIDRAKSLLFARMVLEASSGSLTYASGGSGGHFLMTLPTSNAPEG